MQFLLKLKKLKKKFFRKNFPFLIRNFNYKK